MGPGQLDLLPQEPTHTHGSQVTGVLLPVPWAPFAVMKG